MNHSTVMNVLRESILAKIGLFKKLPNDRYALKWYSEEEEQVNNCYQVLIEMFLRPPTVEEVAIEAKRNPNEVRDLLNKYIQGYREPTKDEVIAAQRAITETIVIGAAFVESKKVLFKKGIVKFIVEGIYQELLHKILNNESAIDLDRCKSYLAKFPEMKPKIFSERQNNLMIYKILWSEHIKKILDKIDSLKQTAEITIPRRLTTEKDSGRLGGADVAEGLEIANLLSNRYVPSEQILSFLLDLASNPHGNLAVLSTLKKFCHNALEVGQLDMATKDLLIPSLQEAAFFGDYNDLNERNIAFDIIGMIDSRNEDTVAVASDYLFERLDENPEDFDHEFKFKGPDIYKVAKFIAKDQALKIELEQKLEHLIRNPQYPYQVSICMTILDQINQKYEKNGKIKSPVAAHVQDSSP